MTDNLEAGAGDETARADFNADVADFHDALARQWHTKYLEAAAQLAAVTAERDDALDKDWVSFPAYEAALKAGRDFRDRATIAAAENARLREALEAIRELNTTGADENGHRWAHSDLVDQEIRAALSQEAPK